MSNFRLSYGPAGQPQQPITIEDGWVVFHGTETQYVMELGDHSDFADGLITILDSVTGNAVIHRAGVGLRDKLGNFHNPRPALSSGVNLSQDGMTLETRHSDSVDGEVLARKHSFTVEGNAVRILIEDVNDNRSFTANYSGVYGGQFDPAASLSVMEMNGTLAVPTVAAFYTEDEQLRPRYFSHFLDITQSNASRFNLQDPKDTIAAHWTYSTLRNYTRTTAGRLHQGLREVLLATVSDNVTTCLIHPSEGSTQIQRMALQPWVFLTSRAASWQHFSDYIEQRQEWGMDRGVVYPQFFWQETNYPTSTIQANGQVWSPAGDEDGYKEFCRTARKASMDVGGYTLWGIQKEGTATYNPDDRVLDADGVPRASVWEEGVWLSREESVSKYMDLHLPTARDEYHWNMVMYDVSTYTSPNSGNGDNVDATVGSHAGTLREVISQRRAWMKHGKDLISSDAYAYGEAGRVNFLSSMEFLYAGAVDGVHGWVNTNSGSEELDNTDASRTISNWPIILEHNWHVTNQYFTNTGNMPDRFFSPDDRHLQDAGVDQLYPFSRKMHDRLRTYELMLGRTGTTFVNGIGTDYFHSAAEQLKEYYIINTLTAVMRDGTIPTIAYDAGNGLETFNELYLRLGLDGFRNCKVLMSFSSSYQVYVNRSDSNWTLPDILGIDVVVPPDGYFAVGVLNNLVVVGGSCQSSLTGNKRIDFVLIPGRFLLADGRGEVESFLNLKLNGRLALRHDSKKFQLTEEVDGSITRTELQ